MTRTITVKEITVPPKTIMVEIKRDVAGHESRTEMFFEPHEFLEFFKPLVSYYEGVKHASETE
jgi:hypothetical protein